MLVLLMFISDGAFFTSHVDLRRSTLEQIKRYQEANKSFNGGWPSDETQPSSCTVDPEHTGKGKLVCWP
jgi:hypothetical protein